MGKTLSAVHDILRMYKKYNNINVGDIIDVYGKVERRNDKYQIVVSSINVLNK